ncbi:hypothetical protein PsorP6_000846 [Peronosclerospora sorghi]|uniref:Uncharacterized protein n=1 Tax=Peronosclerospora sorghi TaxID=230839 RepID=A0ACC0WT28_9STRA|nr:hypothetical protein PsorP6_000846 [Peronosclerospora sorghi]
MMVVAIDTSYLSSDSAGIPCHHLVSVFYVVDPVSQPTASPTAPFVSSTANLLRLQARWFSSPWQERIWTGCDTIYMLPLVCSIWASCLDRAGRTPMRKRACFKPREYGRNSSGKHDRHVGSSAYERLDHAGRPVGTYLPTWVAQASYASDTPMNLHEVTTVGV